MRNNEWALRTIEQHRRQLTRQQFKTLMGQAKAGDPDAAMKGLQRLLLRRTGNEGACD